MDQIQNVVFFFLFVDRFLFLDLLFFLVMLLLFFFSACLSEEMIVKWLTMHIVIVNQAIDSILLESEACVLAILSCLVLLSIFLDVRIMGRRRLVELLIFLLTEITVNLIPELQTLLVLFRLLRFLSLLLFLFLL